MRNYLKAHGGDDYHTIILLFECHFFYITDYSKCYNDKDYVSPMNTLFPKIKNNGKAI